SLAISRRGQRRAAVERASESGYTSLHSERTPEPPRGIVRVRAVVVDPHRAEAIVAEHGAAELSDLRRRFQPARRRRVERLELLQAPVRFLGQEIGAHVRGELDRAGFRLVLLPRFERFTVVANAAAAFGALRGAIDEDVLLRLPVLADDVGFAARPFHLVQRPQLAGMRFQALAHLVPLDALVAVHVLLETGLQRRQQLVSLALLETLLTLRSHALAPFRVG